MSALESNGSKRTAAQVPLGICRECKQRKVVCPEMTECVVLNVDPPDPVAPFKRVDHMLLTHMLGWSFEESQLSFAKTSRGHNHVVRKLLTDDGFALIPQVELSRMVLVVWYWSPGDAYPWKLSDPRSNLQLGKNSSNDSRSDASLLYSKVSITTWWNSRCLPLRGLGVLGGRSSRADDVDRVSVEAMVDGLEYGQLRRTVSNRTRRSRRLGPPIGRESAVANPERRLFMEGLGGDGNAYTFAETRHFFCLSYGAETGSRMAMQLWKRMSNYVVNSDSDVLLCMSD